MSRKRQAAQSQKARQKRLDGSVLVRTFGVTFTEGHVLKAHRHEWDQFTYATHGVLTVKTDEGTWVIPPHRAVWVPAGIEHVEVMSGPVAARSLFFMPRPGQIHAPRMYRRQCFAAAPRIGPRHHSLRLSRPQRSGASPTDRHHPGSVRSAWPKRRSNSKLPAIPALYKSPRCSKKIPRPRTPPLLARQAGASKRTIERLFKAETGVSFQQWRQRLRVIQALRLLASGESVTSVALDVGYSGTSAFIAMFKSELGTTPRRIWKEKSATIRPNVAELKK